MLALSLRLVTLYDRFSPTTGGTDSEPCRLALVAERLFLLRQLCTTDRDGGSHRTEASAEASANLARRWKSHVSEKL